MPRISDIDIMQIVTIGGCLLLAAFLAAAKATISSFGSFKAKQLNDNNHHPQLSLDLWLNHPERLLTTVLLYRTVVHALTAILAADFAMRHFASHVVGIVTAAVTLAILLAGEIVPRALAKPYSHVLALPCLRGVYTLYILAFPLVWVFAEIYMRISESVGGVQSESPPITEEDIEYLVDVGERHGVIEETKKDMIAGIFEFDETKVREIMTPRPDIHYLYSDSNFDEALALAIDSGMSRIPVCDENGIDHVMGILLVKDLLKVARTRSAEARAMPAKGAADFSLKSFMREPFFVPESKLIMDVFKDLKSTKNHIAIVIDEHGGTAGLVTMEDILEEIVGEIQDEFDTEEAEIVELEPGIYDVAGSYNIDEFLEFFEIDEDTISEQRGEDVDTIAGWITSLIGDLPEVGKTVRIGPLNVEVGDVERRRVRRVRVSRVLDAGQTSASLET